MTTIKLGSYVVPQPGSDSSDKLLLMLIWGTAGCGKSTLAATAPGKKLWLGFDPGAVDSMPIPVSRGEILEQWRRPNPNKLQEFITEHGIDTVVLDSVTTLVDLATQHAIAHVRSATVENPGMKGYGHRNAVTMQVISQIMIAASKAKAHFIIIGHEDAPELSEEGHIVAVKPLIGGKMVNGVPLRLGEVWHMEDVKGKKRIQTRQVRHYKPMKTRMFSTTGEAEFNWKFNPDDWSGQTISEWYNQWKENEWNKIQVPK